MENIKVSLKQLLLNYLILRSVRLRSTRPIKLSFTSFIQLKLTAPLHVAREKRNEAEQSRTEEENDRSFGFPENL